MTTQPSCAPANSFDFLVAVIEFGRAAGMEPSDRGAVPLVGIRDAPPVPRVVVLRATEGRVDQPDPCAWNELVTRRSQPTADRSYVLLIVVIPVDMLFGLLETDWFAGAAGGLHRISDRIGWVIDADLEG